MGMSNEQFDSSMALIAARGRHRDAEKNRVMSRAERLALEAQLEVVMRYARLHPDFNANMQRLNEGMKQAYNSGILAFAEKWKLKGLNFLLRS